jgi:hypothetical protein
VRDEEIERLRGLLEAMVEGSGRSQSDIERSIGLGHGYLSHLFAGRLELKFKHVFLLGSELGFSPSDFFQRAYPLASHEPAWPMEEVEEGFHRTGAALRSPAPGPPVDRDAMKELIREVLTEALLPEGGPKRQPVRREQRGRKRRS